MASEVAGLDESGTHYIVEKGDTGEKIAMKLTGDKSRWKELKATNPKIMGRDPKLVQQYGFPIYVGDSVILPQSWVKVPESQVIPTPATVQQPVTAVPVAVSLPAGDIAAQGQARTILAAWGATDGALLAGVSDYGSPAEIGATTWTARDKLQASSFAGWWNSGANNPQVIGGEWSDNLAKALNIWAERKATQVAQVASVQAATPVPAPTPAPAPAPATPKPPVADIIVPNDVLPPSMALPSTTPKPPATTPAPKPTATTPAPKPAASTSPASSSTSTTAPKVGWGWIIGGIAVVGIGITAAVYLSSEPEKPKAA